MEFQTAFGFVVGKYSEFQTFWEVLDLATCSTHLEL